MMWQEVWWLKVKPTSSCFWERNTQILSLNPWRCSAITPGRCFSLPFQNKVEFLRAATPQALKLPHRGGFDADSGGCGAARRHNALICVYYALKFGFQDVSSSTKLISSSLCHEGNLVLGSVNKNVILGTRNFTCRAKWQTHLIKI